MSDLISRQVAIDALDTGLLGVEWDKALATAMLKDLPSAEPERKRGRWIHQVKFGRIECDQCGKVYRNTFSPKYFCPNCGSHMKGANDETN